MGLNLKERLFTLEFILLIFVLVGSLVFNFFPIPELVKGFFASFLFVIISYLVGNMFFHIRFIKERLMKLDFISYAFISWSAGTIIIVLSTISLYAFNLFTIKSFVYLLLLSFTLFYLFSRNEKLYFLEKPSLLALGLLSISAIVVILFLLYSNPFPLWGEWDFHYTHNFLANYIANYNQIFKHSVYLPTFSILIASSSYLFNADTYAFGWVLANLLLPLVTLIAIYYFINSFNLLKSGKGFLIILSLTS